MSIKYRDSSGSLRCFLWNGIDRTNNAINVCMVAANTIEDAIDMILDNFGKAKWNEKTRNDFRRQDHYNAWVSHNRDKEYAKYIRTRDKERKNIIKDIQELPYTKYSGNPGVVYENYIKIN